MQRLTSSLPTLLTTLICFAASSAAHVAQATPLTGGTGPAGFELANGASGLQMWLRGDRGLTLSGSNITTWEDQSGNNRDVTQANALEQPTVGTRNGLDIFDGTAAGHQFLETAAFSSGFTQGNLIMAMRVVHDTDGTQVGGPHNVGTGNNLHHPWADGNIYETFGNNVRHNTGNPVLPLDQWHVYDVTATNPNFASRVNGALQFSTGANNTATGFNTHSGSPFAIGRQQATYLWDGEIGDYILYNRALNAAETILTQNHLSSKYSIGINGAVDFYDGDTLANGDYDYDLIGVGRQDASNQVTNAGAEGFGIEVVAGAGVGQLNDGDYILAAHKTPTNSVVTIEGLAENELGTRWERIWYIDTNASGTDATLGFNFDDAGLGAFFDAGDDWKLLFSDSDNPTEWQVLGVDAVLAPGNVVTFDVDSDLLQDGYYTLALNIVALPEPGTCLLLGGPALGMIFAGRRRRQAARS